MAGGAADSQSVRERRNSRIKLKEMARHVPPGVSACLNEGYDATDNDAYLDAFYPSSIENTEKTWPRSCAAGMS